MGSKRTEVGASAVREWFATLSDAEKVLTDKEGNETVLSVGQRGKLSDDVIKAFEKATRNRYVPGFVERRKITGKRPDSKGRLRDASELVTLPEVRAWAATPEAIAAGVKVGARGRVSSATLAAFLARPKAPSGPAPVQAAAPAAPVSLVKDAPTA